MWLGGGQEGLSYLVPSPGFESGKVCSGEKRFLSWKLPTILSLKNLLGVQSRIGRETRSRLYLGISILTGKPLRGTGQFHRKALGILELHRVSERGDAKLWIKHFSEDVLSWARDRLWGEDKIISDVLNYRVVQVNCESTSVTSCFEVQSMFVFPRFCHNSSLSSLQNMCWFVKPNQICWRNVTTDFGDYHHIKSLTVFFTKRKYFQILTGKLL